MSIDTPKQSVDSTLTVIAVIACPSLQTFTSVTVAGDHARTTVQTRVAIARSWRWRRCTNIHTIPNNNSSTNILFLSSSQLQLLRSSFVSAFMTRRLTILSALLTLNFCPSASLSLFPSHPLRVDGNSSYELIIILFYSLSVVLALRRLTIDIDSSLQSDEVFQPFLHFTSTIELCYHTHVCHSWFLSNLVGICTGIRRSRQRMFRRSRMDCSRTVLEAVVEVLLQNEQRNQSFIDP